MIAIKHFSKLNLVVITLAHFFPIYCNHVVVNPISCRLYVIANGALSYLTFMMGKKEVHSTPMYIKLRTQIFCSHCRTFYVPPGETLTPGAFPAHYMLKWC